MISVISCHIHPPDMDVTFTCLNTICKRQKTGLLNVVSGGFIGRLLPGVPTLYPSGIANIVGYEIYAVYRRGFHSGLWC